MHQTKALPLSKMLLHFIVLSLFCNVALSDESTEAQKLYEKALASQDILSELVSKESLTTSSFRQKQKVAKKERVILHELIKEHKSSEYLPYAVLRFLTLNREEGVPIYWGIKNDVKNIINDRNNKHRNTMLVLIKKLQTNKSSRFDGASLLYSMPAVEMLSNDNAAVIAENKTTQRQTTGRHVNTIEGSKPQYKPSDNVRNSQALTQAPNSESRTVSQDEKPQEVVASKMEDLSASDLLTLATKDQDWEHRKLIYEYFLKRFPNERRAPDVMFGLAAIHAQLKQNDEALNVISQFEGKYKSHPLMAMLRNLRQKLIEDELKVDKNVIESKNAIKTIDDVALQRIKLIQRLNSNDISSKTEYDKLVSEIGYFANDIIPPVLTKLSNEFITDLSENSPITSDSFNDWHSKKAFALRFEIKMWQQLYELAFSEAKDNSVRDYYGGEKDELREDRSPYKSVYRNLSDKTYLVFEKTFELPSATSASLINSLAKTKSTSGLHKVKSSNSFKYRLLTPTEYLFAGMGEQAGAAASGVFAKAADLNKLEISIQRTRKLLFECFPDCADLAKLKSQFSGLLMQKDFHFLSVSGRDRSLMNVYSRGMSAALEGISNESGFTIIDGGVDYFCQNEFLIWSLDYQDASHEIMGGQLDDSLKALADFASGNIGSIKSLGHKQVAQKLAVFDKTLPSYRKYQFCRDVSEFDNGNILKQLGRL